MVCQKTILCKFSDPDLGNFFNFRYSYVENHRIVVDGEIYDSVYDYENKLLYDFGSDPYKLYEFIKDFDGNINIGCYFHTTEGENNSSIESNICIHDCFRTRENFYSIIEKIKNIKGVDLDKIIYFVEKVNM